MQSEILIEHLIEQTRLLLNQAEKYKTQPIEKLKWRSEQESWNILECLEHLNLYGDYYLTEIENSIRNTKTKSAVEFKSGILGSYFAKSMLPKDKLNKMKTFKDKNPLNADLNKTTIDRFVNQQIKLIDLLNKSREVNLNEVKIKTSISSLLRLRLGDTFQFIINHNLRHFRQIEGIETRMKNSFENKAFVNERLDVLD